MPGLEHARHVGLDRHCEALGEIREVLALERAKEKESKTAGTALMIQYGVKVYHHAGVELALIPGEAHLRIRLTGSGEHEDRGPLADLAGGDGDGEGDDTAVDA